MVKSVSVTMVLFYIFVFFLGQPIIYFLFPYGGGPESYLYPIYLGIVTLSGLIVGCTYYLAKLIKDLNSVNPVRIEAKKEMQDKL